MNGQAFRPALTRRRFLTISGAAFGLAMAPGVSAAGVPLHRWRGIALGAGAEIRLHHPDATIARRLLAAAETEIRRLEAIFSLYDADSALSRLNRDGRLAAPPLDMVELLGLSRQVHDATDGAFDPTVQRLWQLHAEWYARRPQAYSAPPDAEIEAVLQRTGLRHVRVEPDSVSFARAGMGLTLNGIAQGFITDRISALLRDGGITDVLVDLGEINALGSPDGGADGWPVVLDPDHDRAGERIRLLDRAVASSARHGTTFDAAGRAGHILDPRTGRPAQSDLAGASVVAQSAALADGLSTAALVCGKSGLAEALRAFPGTSARLAGEAGHMAAGLSPARWRLDICTNASEKYR